jgi:RHS repeat-associated protein
MLARVDFRIGVAYVIDAWGNMTAINSYQGKAHENLSCGPANTQNQLNTCYSYDSAGNLVANGSATYTYDGENRLVGTAGWTYVYDGDGNRVRKFGGSNGTLYWPDTNAKALGETDQSGNPRSDYVFFNGTRIARFDVKTLAVHYYFSNHLGTHTVVTNATGSCEQDIEYYPYGGQRMQYCSTPVAQNYKFTGKERDTESSLDDFGARHYSSTMGRFMTPDWSREPDPVPYADYENPQTHNLYQYVENNPLNARDPDGHRLECHTKISPPDSQGNIKVSLDCHEEPDPSVLQQYELWRRGFVDRWNKRIDAHRPPPQKQDENLQFLQNINNLMLGLVPYKAPIARTLDGKVHDVPDHVPDDWTHEDLELAKGELEGSIKARNAEANKLGEDGPHRDQIRKEEHLLRQVNKKPSGS